jgi:hypothetical protein
MKLFCHKFFADLSTYEDTIILALIRTLSNVSHPDPNYILENLRISKATIESENNLKYYRLLKGVVKDIP